MDFDCRAPDPQDDARLAEDVAFLARDPAQVNAIEAAARQRLAEVRPRGAEGPAASRFKVSRYDIAVRLRNGAELLFNSRTRSLILLAETEAAAYRALGEAGSFRASEVADPLLLQALTGGGHVIGETVDELEVVRQSYEAAREAPGSLSLTIAPTMACNFACGYCFQGLKKPTRKMQPDVQDAIIDFVKARTDTTSLSIVWYGGEPLMGKDSIFRLSDRLIAYCDKRNIAYSAGIVSNAWFLNGEMAAQLYARRVKWVQVTIDGDRETHDKMRPLTSGHGTFDRILKNISETLDETAMQVNVRVNVGISNVDRANEMLDGFAERDFARRGAFTVYFAPIEASTPESEGALEEKLARADFNARVLALEEKARRLGFASIQAPPTGFAGMCVAASKGGYVISGEGDVHKCWETAHDATKRTGTIFEPDKLTESANAKLWSEWTPFDSSICSSCKILPMCGGFCGHRFVYGDPDEAALPCPSWKWNTAEYVFSRAKDLGVVAEDQWLSEEATVEAKQSGERHSAASLREAQDRVLERVSAKLGRRVDREMLMAGEPALDRRPQVKEAALT
jgi:uncharacterized protein